MTITNDFLSIFTFLVTIYTVIFLSSHVILRYIKQVSQLVIFTINNAIKWLSYKLAQSFIFAIGWGGGLLIGGYIGGIVGLTVGGAIAGAIEGYQDETVGSIGWTIGGAWSGATFGIIFWLNQGQTPIGLIGWGSIGVIVGIVVGVVIGGISYWQNEVQLKTSPVELLSNQQILSLCDLQMTEAEDKELANLLELKAEGELGEIDQRRLDKLMQIYRHGLLRKSEALKIAVQRGLRPRLDA